MKPGWNSAEMFLLGIGVLNILGTTSLVRVNNPFGYIAALIVGIGALLCFYTVFLGYKIRRSINNLNDSDIAKRAIQALMNERKFTEVDAKLFVFSVCLNDSGDAGEKMLQAIADNNMDDVAQQMFHLISRSHNIFRKYG